MFDEFNNYQPDYCYSAPAFDTGPAFDPFELTFDAPDVEPASYQPTADDPMAYILPAVVDSFAFDMSSPNAAVGFAMNEVARMLQYNDWLIKEAREQLEVSARVCAQHNLIPRLRGDGWIELSQEQLEYLEYNDMNGWNDYTTRLRCYEAVLADR